MTPPPGPADPAAADTPLPEPSSTPGTPLAPGPVELTAAGGSAPAHGSPDSAGFPAPAAAPGTSSAGAGAEVRPLVEQRLHPV
ncbi:2-oxoglutarate dehydrogenase, E2 component, dihydrolipoamide succinyltransferase, partial [Streptomyces sp. NPDC005568]